MGNSQSQFEEQFNQRYSFITLIDDLHFGRIKVYRKIQYDYDYIMVVEGQLKNLPQQEMVKMQDHLHLIRSHQVDNIIKLFHFRVIREDKIECQASLLRVYAQYFNKTLYDYLLQLRTKKIMLSIDERYQCTHCFSKYRRSYPEMRIYEFELHSRTIFISLIGQIYLSPIHEIKRWLHVDRYYQPISKTNKQYKPQLSKLKSKLYFPEKTIIKDLFYQLTEYMSTTQFPTTRPIYSLIESSRNLEDLLQKIPPRQIQRLIVDQIIKPNQIEKQGQNYVYQ